MHALGKRILEVSAAGIRDRLADLCPDHLPNLEQARDLIAAAKRVSLDNKVDDSYSLVRVAPKLVNERKQMRTVSAEKKTRAAGKERRRDQVTKQLVIRCTHVPLDHLVTEPSTPGGSPETENARIDQLRHETPEPPGNSGTERRNFVRFNLPAGTCWRTTPPGCNRRAGADNRGAAYR